jgi:hypothetical protein
MDLRESWATKLIFNESVWANFDGGLSNESVWDESQSESELTREDVLEAKIQNFKTWSFMSSSTEIELSDDFKYTTKGKENSEEIHLNIECKGWAVIA